MLYFLHNQQSFKFLSYYNPHVFKSGIFKFIRNKLLFITNMGNNWTGQVLINIKFAGYMFIHNGSGECSVIRRASKGNTSLLI